MLPGASRRICITWYMFPGLDLYYKDPAQHSITRYTSSTVYDLDDLDVGRDIFHAYLVAGLLGWSFGWSVGWLVGLMGRLVRWAWVCLFLGWLLLHIRCVWVFWFVGWICFFGWYRWMVGLQG